MNKLTSLFQNFLRPNPLRDWAMTLLLLALVFLGTAIYGIYLYVALSSGSVFGAASHATPPIAVTADEIHSVLMQYQTRQTAYVGHTTTIPSLVDPAK